MKNLILDWVEKIINLFFGEKCTHCGSRETSRSYNFTRGYNEFCKQAAGDSGIFCCKCLKVTWDQPYEEYVKKLPKWVNPYPHA
jgi:hypothetical protein